MDVLQMLASQNAGCKLPLRNATNSKMLLDRLTRHESSLDHSLECKPTVQQHMFNISSYPSRQSRSHICPFLSVLELRRVAPPTATRHTHTHAHAHTHTHTLSFNLAPRKQVHTHPLADSHDFVHVNTVNSQTLSTIILCCEESKTRQDPDPTS